jgi:hypothetical protein
LDWGKQTLRQMPLSTLENTRQPAAALPASAHTRRLGVFGGDAKTTALTEIIPKLVNDTTKSTERPMYKLYGLFSFLKSLSLSRKEKYMKPFAKLLLFTLVSGLVAHAATPPQPFAKTCLSGRYVTAGSGLDVYFGNAFAVAGYVNLTCTPGQDKGTYTGLVTVTYPYPSNQYYTLPNTTVQPNTCALTGGTYTIDPTTGAITAQATLGPASSGTCIFTSATYSQAGYLSDPLGAQIFAVDESPAPYLSGGYTNVLSLIFTKAPATANQQ